MRKVNAKGKTNSPAPRAWALSVVSHRIISLPLYIFNFFNSILSIQFVQFNSFNSFNARFLLCCCSKLLLFFVCFVFAGAAVEPV